MNQIGTAQAAGPRERYWTMRLLRPDEDEALARLSRVCFGQRGDTLEFIRQRYTHGGLPRAAVWVADHAGEPIASQAVTFLPFHARGREVTVGMFTAGMTHPEHRKRGIFREVVAVCADYAFEQGAECLFTMPNEESFPAFAKMPRWRCLADRRLRAVVLDAAGLLRDRGFPRWAAAAVGRAAHWRGKWRRQRAAAHVEESAGLSILGGDLDALAEEVGRRTGRIICRRDRAFLGWRFDQNPSYRYRYFVSRGCDGIDGYLVTTTEHRKGTTLAHVVDWLAGQRPGVVADLLSAAARAAREDGATLLTLICTGGAPVEEFAAFGFRRVPARLAGRGFHTAVCPGPADPASAAYVADDANWHLTLADFDTI